MLLSLSVLNICMLPEQNRMNVSGLSFCGHLTILISSEDKCLEHVHGFF